MSWLIVGLGNPGRKYQKTRHNLGFVAVDYLVSDNYATFANKENICNAECFIGLIAKEKVIIVKPLTFMNNSGQSVLKLSKKFDIPLENIVLVYDDVDLDVGKIRIKRGGGSGGHRGVQSVIDSLGTREILRVKIGVGRPPAGMDTADYVLMAEKEKNKIFALEESVWASSDVINSLVREGVEKTMNNFND